MRCLNMYCSNCGSKILNNASFCSNCGSRVVNSISNNSISKNNLHNFYLMMENYDKEQLYYHDLFYKIEREDNSIFHLVRLSEFFFSLPVTFAENTTFFPARYSIAAALSLGIPPPWVSRAMKQMTLTHRKSKGLFIRFLRIYYFSKLITKSKFLSTNLF